MGKKKVSPFSNYIDGYIDSAEPREKRIAELEVQVEKMKCCSNSQTVRDTEGNCYLKKTENAELKAQMQNKINTTTVSDYPYSALKLEEAKELIENIIRVTWGEGWNYSLDWKVKAEQFLKDSEVEK